MKATPSRSDCLQARDAIKRRARCEETPDSESELTHPEDFWRFIQTIQKILLTNCGHVLHVSTSLAVKIRPKCLELSGTGPRVNSGIL